MDAAAYAMDPRRQGKIRAAAEAAFLRVGGREGCADGCCGPLCGKEKMKKSKNPLAKAGQLVYNIIVARSRGTC